MILDAQNIYSGVYTLSGGTGTWVGQALTNGTTLSTNVVDHSPSLTPAGTNQNVQIGLGEPMAIVLEVSVAPVSTAGTETYTVNLLTDTAANLTTSPVTLASLTIDKATLVNTKFVLMIPANLNFKRFSGLQYVLGGNADAAISIIAEMLPSLAIQNHQDYNSGWTIQNS